MRVGNLLLFVFLLGISHCVHGQSVCTSFCTGVASGTVLVNPSSRHSYYVCLNNEARLFDCGSGLVYDPKSFMCVRESASGGDSDCDGSNQPQPTTTCAPPVNTPCITNPNRNPSTSLCTGVASGTVLLNPSSRHSYYLCVNNEARLFDCGNGLVYDPKSLMCVRESANDDCGCDGSHNPHHTTTCAPPVNTPCTTRRPSRPHTRWTPCVTRTPPCDHNHHTPPCTPPPCDGSNVVVRGYLRSRARDCRNEADGVVFLDKRNQSSSSRSKTTRYYVCQNGRAVRKDCEANHWFDQIEKKCVIDC